MKSKMTFAALDRSKGVAPLPQRQGEEMPLPAWYRSVYNTPIDELTVEDLCKAGRQSLHVEVIVPLIIERLREDPLAGEMFDGELLDSLRNVGKEFWADHRKEALDLRAILEASSFPDVNRVDAQEILRLI